MTAVLHLDEELAGRLREAAAASGVAFEQAAEEAIRRGVRQMPRRVAAVPYRMAAHDFGGHVENPSAVQAALDEVTRAQSPLPPPHDFGNPPEFDYRKALEILDNEEVAAYRGTIRQ